MANIKAFKGFRPKNGLEEKELILQSEAWMVARPNLSPALQAIFNKIVFRLKSVLAAKNNKYLLMNAPNESLKSIIEVLPGIKSPTIMPLAQEGWSSIHTVINEDKFWDIIEELKAQGAQGMLVIPIQKMII